MEIMGKIYIHKYLLHEYSLGSNQLILLSTFESVFIAPYVYKLFLNSYLLLLIFFKITFLKDQLESVLEVLHRQMEQYKEQPQHTEKISYQQRLLQEDLIHIRAEISKVSTVSI